MLKNKVIVVILIPLPVDTGDAPINIIKRVIKSVGNASILMGTVVKPPLLNDTA